MPQKLQQFIEKPWFLKVIMYLIVFNSIILGLKSYPGIMEHYGTLLNLLDDVMISIFVCEILLYLIVYGPRKCFNDPWYIFDFVVIAVTILPAVVYLLSYFFDLKNVPDLGHFSALRAMRVLRILRLISIFPSLKNVIQGLLTAIPGIGSIATILMITLYVSALMATNLFGTSFPDWFGSLQHSLFTLFQIMSTEGWPEIVRTVMKTYPYAWIFFVLYILVATFIILNLFIAVIVEAMQKEEGDKEEAIKLQYLEDLTANLTRVEEKLENKLDELNECYKRGDNKT